MEICGVGPGAWIVVSKSIGHPIVMVLTLISVFTGSVVIRQYMWVGTCLAKNWVQMVPTVVKLLTLRSRMAAPIMLLSAQLFLLRTRCRPASDWRARVLMFLLTPLAVLLTGSRFEIQSVLLVLMVREQGFMVPGVRGDVTTPPTMGTP